MHSLFDERIPNHEINSRTMVSLTLVLVKNRFVDVAPIAFRFFKAFIPLDASECLMMLNSPIAPWPDRIVCRLSSYFATVLDELFPPKWAASVFLSVDYLPDCDNFSLFYLLYFSMKRVSFSSKSLISYKKLFLWWKMLSWLSTKVTPRTWNTPSGLERVRLPS